MERRVRYQVAGLLSRDLRVLEAENRSAEEQEEAAEWAEWPRAYELWMSDKAPNTRRAYESAKAFALARARTTEGRGRAERQTRKALDRCPGLWCL